MRSNPMMMTQRNDFTALLATNSSRRTKREFKPVNYNVFHSRSVLFKRDRNNSSF